MICLNILLIRFLSDKLYMTELKTLIQCAEFLSEILNKKSSSINSALMPHFMIKFSKILNLTDNKLNVAIKPIGKNCLLCRTYIPSHSLSKAVGL